MSHVIAHDFDAVPRTEDVKSANKVDFSTMLLPDTILNGLTSSGFKSPSPIQLAALPLARCGLDLVVQAKSGTGKTLVFALAALEAVQVSIRNVQVIILAPTREIALQIADVISSVGCEIGGLNVGTFIGGTSMECDKKEAKRCQIVVGAPGRIRHLIDLEEMDVSGVRLFVLDEADKLMDETFMNDINYIFWKTAESKQVLACSATYTNELVGFLSNYMRSGRHVTPDGNPTPVLLGLKQFAKVTSDHPNSVARFHFKQKALFWLLSSIQFDQCLIFSNYQTRAESLCLHLQSKGWASVWMAGKQEQESRIDALNKLKEHKARVLVTTDLAARGIDARNVNLVINVDVPFDPNTYLHRMGRAGRYGSHGIVVSIVSEGIELKAFREMLGMIGGQSMSVSCVPKQGNIDLWTKNINSFKQITGVVPEKPIKLRFPQKPFGQRGGQASDSSSDSESSFKATVSVTPEKKPLESKKEPFEPKKEPFEPRELVSYADLDTTYNDFEGSTEAPDNVYKIQNFLESHGRAEELANEVCKVVSDSYSESNDGDSGNVDKSPDSPDTPNKEQPDAGSLNIEYSDSKTVGNKDPKFQSFSSMMDSLKAFTESQPPDGKSKLETLEDRLQSALGYTDRCFQQLLDSDSELEPSMHFVGDQNSKKTLINDALCDFCVNNLPPDEIQPFSSLADSLEAFNINQSDSSPVFRPRETYRDGQEGRNGVGRKESIESSSSSDSSNSQGVYFVKNSYSQIVTVPMKTSNEKWYEMWMTQCQQINEYVGVCSSYRY